MQEHFLTWRFDALFFDMVIFIIGIICLPAVVLLFWQKYPLCLQEQTRTAKLARRVEGRMPEIKPCAPNARPSQTSCLLGCSSTCVLASAGRELAHPCAQTPRPFPSVRCRTSRLAHGALLTNTRSCAELSLRKKSCEKLK
jgi:hypothetical protein